MATTHKRSPQAIAKQVLKSNPPPLDPTGLVCLTLDEVESLIMLGIAAYTDTSNQRPENLSEACRRLGINLHWKPSSHLPAGPDSYYVYFDHQKPVSSFTTEQQTIIEIEELSAKYPEVSIWVEAAS